MPTVLTPEVAERWIERWDHQQEAYITRREDRFRTVVDAVALVGGATPVVVDLGCGPGSLGARVRAALPGARVVGVDADPVLLALARAAHPDLELVDADLTDETWPTATGLAPGSVDAVVSSTALHWLTPTGLRGVAAACARLLRPGGIWLDADHVGLPSAAPGLQGLAVRLRERALPPTGPVADPWRSWWDEVLVDPALQAPAAARAARAHRHPDQVDPGYDDYVAALREAGFGEVADLWRDGDDAVLAALR